MNGEFLHDPDWEDLRHFSRFCGARSLSATARELGVDHATVSRRIAALEATLGVKLLDRRTRVPSLTEEGERMATIVLRMQTEAFAVARAARGASKDATGEVSVSAPPALAAALIAPKVGSLKRRHPSIVLRLTGEKRVASLARREADIAIRLSRPTEDGLVTRRLGTIPFGAYASRDYLAGRRSADFAFIGGSDERALPQERWLHKVAGSRPFVFFASDLDGQLAAARAGIGIAVLPDFLARPHSDLGLLRTRTRPSREVWLVVHEDLRAAKAARAVLSFLEEALHDALGT